MSTYGNKVLVLFVSLIVITLPVRAQMDVPTDDQVVIILFDRSASMRQDMDGQPRIELARRQFENWSASLAGRSNVSVRFFAGGTNTENEQANCEASELAIPLGTKIDTPDMSALIAGVQSVGRKTNISWALERAKQDLLGHSLGEISGKIILISDGLENCEGDPERVAQELGDLGFQVDVIGIGEPEDVGGLGKIALASGGQFNIASNASQLSQQMQNQLPDFGLPNMGPAAGGEAAGGSLVSIFDAATSPASSPAPAIESLKLENEQVAEAGPKNVAIEIVLDLSGSMWGRIDNRTKIEIAREALDETLSGLDQPLFLVGLRAYGFDESVPKTKQASCPNTELLTRITAKNLTAIRNAAHRLRPYGYTPLAASLTLAGEDLSGIDAASRMIVLITDGKETCDGDPIAAAAALCAAGIEMEAHVIGFDLEPDVVAEMKKVASAGCGTYTDAKDAKQLNAALTSIVEGAQNKIDPTWLRSIYPIEGGATPETAVPITPGTYTLTRALAKDEQMYFRVNISTGQHGLLRGLIQSKRLIRKGGEVTESEHGLAQFTLTVFPPDDEKGRGRGMRLAGGTRYLQEYWTPGYHRGGVRICHWQQVRPRTPRFAVQPGYPRSRRSLSGD